VAAVQVAPEHRPLSAESIAANCEHAVSLVRQCVAATGAELVVLPEATTTGFAPGLNAHELWDLVSEIPGPAVEPFASAAQELSIHLLVGSYERGGRRGEVYNSAALFGPAGLLGIYRKTHPFPAERAGSGGWVTPGNDVCVVDTSLGRIGMLICFDGDYPELARIIAVSGAELICRPSALLRSADIWELTNRARAYDNHVYVIGANATGIDPGGRFYFGNSMIVSPIAEVVARAASHECWVSARLHPDRALASLTPGSSVMHAFDHLADRNLDLIRHHVDVLLSDASSSYAQPGRRGEAAADEGLDGMTRQG